MTPQWIERIAACKDLPSLPAIAVQVLDMAQAAEADLNQIAGVISRDPALTGKLLKTVNSSFYARARAVGTISQAMVVLGLQAVKTLVLGFSLVGGISGKRSATFDHNTYWKHSLFTATAARQIAQQVGVVQAEEAFLSGLLADIGMLVLDRLLGADYKCVTGMPSHHGLIGVELRELGVTHAEVSGHLATQWKLPPLLTVPITQHHAPSGVDDPQLRRLTEIIGMASRCADVFTDAAPANALADVRGTWFNTFAITSDAGDAMMAQIQIKAREVATLFDIQIGETEPYERTLQRANEALVNIMLQTQQQNEQLRMAATTDRLTGLANRAHFEDRMATLWADAAALGKPLSLIMLDLDRFKSVNDTYGHPAGDDVLRAAGLAVATVARQQDMAARFGGEEMVIALPDTPRAIAAAIAERLRMLIRTRPVVTGGVTIKITGSLGVASYELNSPLTTLAHLIKAADLGLYQAKHGGRDRVKVFQPNAAKAA